MSLFDSGKFKRKTPVSYNFMLQLQSIPFIGPLVPFLLLFALLTGCFYLVLLAASTLPEMDAATRKGCMIMFFMFGGPLIWTLTMRVRHGFHRRG